LARRATAQVSLAAFLNFLLAAPAVPAGPGGDLVLLGNKHYLRGNVEEARADYRKAVAARPDDARAHYNLGVVLFETADLDGALTQFEEAARREPGRAEAWSNLAIVLCGKGFFDQAEDAARRALAADPDFAPAYNNLGLILDAQGRSAKAREAFDAALARDPRLAEAHNNRGNALARAGQSETAAAAYAAGVGANPRLAYLYFNRGLLALRSGDQAGAVREWEKARKLDPSSAPNEAIASVALRGGDYEKAIRYFEASGGSGVAPVPTRIGDFKPLFSPAGIDDPNFPRRRAGVAHARAAAAPKGDPKKLSQEYTDFGRVSMERGLDERAQRLLEEALELDPSNVLAREALGSLYLKKGEANQAVSVLAPIEQSTRSASLLVGLGDAYERASRLQDALRVYERAAGIDPKNARAQAGLGWILIRTHRYDDGLAALARSLSLAPNDAYARVTYADALQIADRPEHAEREYQRTIRTNPEDARAHAHYASFLASQKRYADARRNYAKALAQDPDAPGVAQELERLGARKPAKVTSVWEGILLMPILPFIGLAGLLTKVAQ